MPATSRRRIVRRAIMALAVVVLLVSGYVGSKIGQSWLVGRGLMSATTANRLNETIFAPLMLCMRYDVCGAGNLPQLCSDAYWHGDAQKKAAK